MRAVFVPLSGCSRISISARVNALLVSDGSAPTQAAQLDRRCECASRARSRGFRLSLRSDRVAARDRARERRRGSSTPRARGRARPPRALGLEAHPVLTYLANTLHTGDRQVPYSLVTAIDLSLVAPGLPAHARRPAPIPPIVINDWTARELAVRSAIRSRSTTTSGRSRGTCRHGPPTSTSRRSCPIAGAAADRDLAPVYPGITDADTLGDWDPPFPIDLKRVRPIDEDYWKQYRTTPKAFVPYEVGQRLWRSRYGDRTSVRMRRPGQPLAPARDAIRDSALRRSSIPPGSGCRSAPCATDGLAASQRLDRLRRVLRVLQFLPRGVGAGARGALLPARRGTARARGRPAARRRLQHAARAPAVRRRRPPARR